MAWLLINFVFEIEMLLERVNTNPPPDLMAELFSISLFLSYIFLLCENYRPPPILYP